MNTKNLLIIAIVTLFTATGFAQHPAKLSTPPGKIIYKKSDRTERTDTTTPKKAPVISKEERYNMPYNAEDGGRVISDKHYVKKGDSFRIKFMFDPSDKNVTGFALDGKKVNRKDINFRKGVWEVTLTPEKSHTYYVSSLNGERVELTFPMRIAVLDSVEYEKVDAQMKEFLKNQDRRYYSYARELLDKHCGKGGFIETMKKKF